MRVALNNHKNSSRKGRFLMHACEKNIGGIKNYFYVIFLCVAKNTQSRDFFSLSALTGMCRNRNKKNCRREIFSLLVRLKKSLSNR